MLSYEEESEYRNAYIFKTTSCTIPSYALWTARSIQFETMHQRIMWWINVKKEHQNNSTLVEWIDSIVVRLQFPDIKKKSTNDNSVKEYCSKRQPHTFECDI